MWLSDNVANYINLKSQLCTAKLGLDYGASQRPETASVKCAGSAVAEEHSCAMKATSGNLTRNCFL